MADGTEARVQEVERSVESLESQVRAQIARTKAGARAVLIIGIIIIIATVVYMTIITNVARKVFEPKGLVDMAEVRIQEEIPGFVETLGESLISQADSNVASMREQVVAQIPVLVERAEGLAGDAIDRLADELEAKVGDVVSEVLEMKKVELDPLINAASVPGNDEMLRVAFQEGMEVIVGQKLDEVMLKFDRTMRHLDWRLDMLNQPVAKLTPDQMLRKEAIATILTFIDDAVKTDSLGEAAEGVLSTTL